MKCEYCGGKDGLKVICDTCLGTHRSNADGNMALYALAKDTPSHRGAYMRSARKGVDLKQREAAEAMGVSTVTVARWESGKYPVSESRIQQLLNLTREMSEEEG